MFGPQPPSPSLPDVPHRGRKDHNDAKAAFTSDAPPSGPPPVDFQKGYASAVIEKSEGSMLTELTLSAGRYAMICFLTNRAGGPPHIMKGMINEVVIK